MTGGATGALAALVDGQRSGGRTERDEGGAGRGTFRSGRRDVGGAGRASRGRRQHGNGTMFRSVSSCVAPV